MLRWESKQKGHLCTGLTGLTDHALTCRLDVFVALLHLLNLCRSIRNEKEMGMVQRCVSKQLRRDANASHLFVQSSLCWKGITLVCPMWNCTAIGFFGGPYPFTPSHLKCLPPSSTVPNGTCESIINALHGLLTGHALYLEALCQCRSLKCL